MRWRWQYAIAGLLLVLVAQQKLLICEMDVGNPSTFLFPY